MATSMNIPCQPGRLRRTMEASASGRGRTVPLPRRSMQPVTVAVSSQQPADETHGAVTLAMKVFSEDLEKNRRRLESNPEVSLMSTLAMEGAKTIFNKVVDAAQYFKALPPQPLKGTVDPITLADSDSRFKQINQDVNLHYKLSKNSKVGKNAPSLLFIHGFNSSVFSWRGLLHPLGDILNKVTGTGTAVAYDRPPYGLSSRPTTWEGGDDRNPYGSKEGAKHGMMLLDFLGLGDTILVAHSAGAPLAMKAARENPDRVKAIVLIAPAVFVDSPLAGATLETYLNLLYTRTMLNIPGANLNYIRSRIRKQLESCESGWAFDFYDKSLITEELTHGYVRPALAHNWDVASLIQYQSFDIQTPELLEGLDIPVLIVQGEHDTTVPAAAVRKLHRALGAKSQYIELDKCGHDPLDECPDRLLEAITPFITKILKKTAAESNLESARGRWPVIEQTTANKPTLQLSNGSDKIPQPSAK